MNTSNTPIVTNIASDVAPHLSMESLTAGLEHVRQSPKPAAASTCLWCARSRSCASC